MLIILSSLLTNSSVLSSLLTGSILSSLLRVSCLPAYQMTLNGRVVDVVSEWGSLYILLRDGRVSLRPLPCYHGNTPPHPADPIGGERHEDKVGDAVQEKPLPHSHQVSLDQWQG